MKSNIEILKGKVRGTKDKGIPNQDYYQILETRSHLILTLADGLGSAKNSLTGAKCVCDTIIRMLKKRNYNLNDDYLSFNIISNWNKCISKNSYDISDFRTTSLFVFVDKNSNQIITGQLGDGLIAIKVDDNEIKNYSFAKDFLNETTCLGSGMNKTYNINIYKYYNEYEILLITDGISDDLEPKKIPMLFEYLKRKYKNLDKKQQNNELKRELKTTMGKFSDDKSLIFAWTNTQ